MILLRCALVLGSTVALCLAESPPAYVSPEVSDDGRVTFRLYAPEAGSVQVEGLRRKQPLEMIRAPDGLWTAVSEPLAPDRYVYVFNVDGLRVTDRKNRQLQRWIDSSSAVEVTAGAAPLWAERAVPHGVLVHHRYTSDVAKGTQADLHVYLPPGYKSGGPPIPLLVLCHGTGDDSNAWIESGKVREIVDNLLAEGRIKPLVIAMPHGHPVPLVLSRTGEYYRENLEPMRKRVLEEVVPFMESTYGTAREPGKRAIAGLSMGGDHALAIGLEAPEIFGWVGAFSPGTRVMDEALLAHTAALEVKMPHLWIAVGENDHLTESNKSLAEALRVRSIPHEFKLTDGGHEWKVWREYLADYLQLLFEDR